MATKKVKNNDNQPHYYNLPGGRSLKIPARSIVEVEEADLNSAQMAFHQSRGSISIVEVPAEAKPGPKPEVGYKPTEKAKDEKGGQE